VKTRELSEALKRARPRTPFGWGAVVLAVVIVVMVGLYFKPTVQTALRSGETITAEFDSNHKLTENESRVLFAGLNVGVVRDIERRDGLTVVSMKVDRSALEQLGAQPSARIVPNTLLSGVFGVELSPGGGSGAFEDDVIPRERTRTPVELDRILESLPAPTRAHLQNFVGQFGDTLASGGRDALRDLVQDAPRTLKPSNVVLRAARGTRPGVDLPRLVTNFEATASVLSQHRGQLSDIFASLQQTTAVLSDESPALTTGIRSLPDALRVTRTGVVDLRGTLERLTATSTKMRPVAAELDSLLRELGPVLREARPLLVDLRPLTRNARPLFDELVPVATRTTRVLHHVRGPVLERVNGPIIDTLTNPWQGTGPYKESGGGYQADHKFYEELGYLVAQADRGSMYQDGHGSMLGFQVGFNLDSFAPAIGGPLTLPDLVRQLQQVTGGQR